MRKKREGGHVLYIWAATFPSSVFIFVTDVARVVFDAVVVVLIVLILFDGICGFVFVVGAGAVFLGAGSVFELFPAGNRKGLGDS